LWSYGWLKIRVAWASEQTKIFDEMRTSARESDSAHAAGCLAYVVGYYPSGSKQEQAPDLIAWWSESEHSLPEILLRIFA
jgi:hypothetical protein